MFFDDLIAKKQSIYHASSLKQQIFYQYIVGEPMNCPPENDWAKNLYICFSAYCIGAPSSKDLAEKLRKTIPQKGMHYTTDLIDLCAMATNDFEQERDSLMSYCQDNSTRDFYILKHLFPDIVHYPPDPLGYIDQIALHLYEGNFPQEGWKSLIFKAFQETFDLHDLYIVEQGYQKAMDDNPIVHRVSDIDYVRDACHEFVVKTERNVNLGIKIISIFLLVSISCWLVPLILKNWDKAEPIMGVVELLRIPIGVLIILFMRYIPDKIGFINAFNEKIIDWRFKRKGHNRSELRNRLEMLK